jgi:hypothetical protein
MFSTSLGLKLLELGEEDAVLLDFAIAGSRMRKA